MQYGIADGYEIHVRQDKRITLWIVTWGIPRDARSASRWAFISELTPMMD
jgi:hypothetical protein